MSIETAKRPPASLSARDLRDTKGAAKIIADRMDKEGKISVDTVHLLVRRNKLKAYIFDEDGLLVERDEHHTKRSGQALYFAMSDLYQVELPREAPGRPRKENKEEISSSSKKSKKTA